MLVNPRGYSGIDGSDEVFFLRLNGYDIVATPEGLQLISPLGQPYDARP